MINYISNLEPDLRSGGFSAMNAAALSVVRTLDEVCYVGPINPAPSRLEHVLSKGLRQLGGRGAFFTFSRRRLEQIATQVSEASRPDARLDFFHGFTPWISTRPGRPYVAWSDCTFHDYVRIYHDIARFSRADIARIEASERRWLQGAQKVLFTSQWACDRAIAHYGLDAGRVASVGIFGEIDPPANDVYEGGRGFAFVSTNFHAKGGPTVLAALRIVRRTHPDASLTVVGDAPFDIASEPGVYATGRLRKEVASEYRTFRSVLASARAVVHPTRSDISPLLLVEAGFFGCPVIATRRFAIPELVEDGYNGYLLDAPGDAEEVAGHMMRMLDAPDYQAMRQASWQNARNNHTKDRFEKRLATHIQDAAA